MNEKNLASLLCMMVIARTKDAVYLRLPKELQEPISCDCKHCKKLNSNGEWSTGVGAWDTLVIANKAPKNANDFSYRVHMPDASIREFLEYVEMKEQQKKRMALDI